MLIKKRLMGKPKQQKLGTKQQRCINLKVAGVWVVVIANEDKISPIAFARMEKAIMDLKDYNRKGGDN